MAEEKIEMIDSQGVTLSYKKLGATTFEEIIKVTDSPLPTKKREVDDVTDVKSTHKQTVAAGVISSDNLEYELLMLSGNKQQTELNTYFESGEMLAFKVELPDSIKTTYSYEGTIIELSPIRTANKKNRYKFGIAVNGKVEVTTTDTP